ncbi:MAG TPA: GYD domain-containing protein [Candidatus Tectomicrobia bacterium]|nr:GYD domain-containing protein [Candidatus Tectomicrobia bacterium]
MARYLFQASYTSDAWAAQVSHPQNRMEVIRPVIERLGGRLESAYLSFGDYDVVLIAEMPDHVSAAAFSLAASAGGAVKAVKTTPLMTIEEGIEAMKKAAGAGYRPPGR